MKLNKLLIISIFSLSIFANAGQSVFGQIKDSPYENTKIKAPVKKDYYSNKKSPVKPSSEWTKRFSGKSHLYNQNKSNYLKHNTNDLMTKMYKSSNRAMSFRYFREDYDYSDKDNVYNRIFESGAKNSSTKLGLFQFGYKKFAYRSKYIDLSYGLDAGVSWSSGKMIFDDGEVSRAKMSLWTLPLDFMLGFKLNLGRSVGLSLAGGPSATGLIQNRSDKESTGKNNRQVGYGYSAMGSLDFSISQMFPKYGFRKSYKGGISDMGLSLFARTTSVSNFKDTDISIEGTSFGIGFIFELL